MTCKNNKFSRIDRLENIVCKQQTRCEEVGFKAMTENNHELSEDRMDRYDQLDLRLERLAHISAKLSAGTNLRLKGV